MKLCIVVMDLVKRLLVPKESVIYQLPLILTALFPDKRCRSHDMCLYQVMATFHFLNDVAFGTESTQKSK